MWCVGCNRDRYGKIRTIYARRVMLRLKETVLLQCACLAVLSLRDVENHGVGVKLRCRISLNRPRRVILEGCCNELVCRLKRMDIADTSLCVALPIHALQHAHSRDVLRARAHQHQRGM